MTVAANRETKSGIDLSFIDREARPQDDLFGHVNGRWLTEYRIPADRATDGAFRTLYDRAEEQIRDLIVESAAAAPDDPTNRDSDGQRIGDLYASFMDEQAVRRRGLSPLLEELADIDAADNPEELAAVLGALQRTGVGGGTALYIDTDSKDSSRYLLHLSQSGIGLPDESYFRDEQHTEVLAAYPDHIAAMFGLVYDGSGQASVGDHAKIAGAIVALESKIAAAHWDVVKRRDADLTYNLLTFAEVIDEAPGFDWTRWLTGMAANDSAGQGRPTEVVVRQPDFLTGFAALWAGENFEDWKNWVRWRVIHARAALLTDELIAEDFAFYGKLLSGTEEIRDRWKRGVSVVENLMGDALGRLYVERYFPPRAKARIDELVTNLREAYRVSISTLEWMTPQTREKALVKLDKFTPKIGYPPKWRDYSSLAIERGDLYGNYRRGYAVEYERELAKLGGPVDRDEWFMTPQTVNAYYNPGMNEIVFPAAILQPPFFDADADDAANYGGIGAVIGHEIGHGFDDQGAKYDGDGNLVDWWTDEDRTEFGLRTKALIDQYENFVPRELATGTDGHHVNGAFTVGENIGDLGGLSIALLAYQLSLNGETAPVIDGLTGQQRVFYGWAQVWRTKSRDAEAIRRLAIDPHSPPEFRCNGVIRNIDSFYEAFEVGEKDSLYLEPQQRVRIWS